MSTEMPGGESVGRVHVVTRGAGSNAATIGQTRPEAAFHLRSNRRGGHESGDSCHVRGGRLTSHRE